MMLNGKLMISSETNAKWAQQLAEQSKWETGHDKKFEAEVARLLGLRVFAAEEVLDEAAYLPPTEEKAVGTEEQVEEFREFLEQVSPEDFVGE